jgi:hypothetical protein
LQSGTIVVDYKRTELGKIQSIPVPANAHPLSELLNAARGSGAAGAALSGLTGGQGAAAAGSQGAGQASTGASAAIQSPGASQATGTAAPKAYLDCLSSAAGDIAKIQACAPLLHGG